LVALVPDKANSVHYGRREFLVFLPRLEQLYLLRSPLDLEKSVADKIEAVGAAIFCLGGNQDAAHALGFALDAAGEVDGVADGGVVLALFRADEADHGGAGMDADADVESLADFADFMSEAFEVF